MLEHDLHQTNGPQLDDALLGAYAAGNCGPAAALLTAAHASLNSEARARLAVFEETGGVMLDQLDPAEIGDDLFDRVMAGLEDDGREDTPAPSLLVDESANAVRLPHAVMEALGTSVEAAPWRQVMRGLEELDLPIPDAEARVKLLRIQPGTAVPQHTHEGEELTLVMTGAYIDATGRYGPGDLAVSDHDIDHRPVAEEGDACICLVVMDAPLKLTGAIGRFLNPFVRF